MENNKTTFFVESKSSINQLNPNLISICLSFLEEQEIINCFKVSKRFNKALQKDFLWKSIVLRENLFSVKTLETSWKDYYKNIAQLKKNFKKGKSNTSFKMKPMRGHKTHITALYQEESENLIISGDNDGYVYSWVWDSVEEEYSYIELEKLSARVMRIL